MLLNVDEMEVLRCYINFTTTGRLTRRKTGEEKGGEKSRAVRERKVSLL